MATEALLWQQREVSSWEVVQQAVSPLEEALLAAILLAAILLAAVRPEELPLATAYPSIEQVPQQSHLEKLLRRQGH